MKVGDKVTIIDTGWMYLSYVRFMEKFLPDRLEDYIGYRKLSFNPIAYQDACGRVIFVHEHTDRPEKEMVYAIEMGNSIVLVEKKGLMKIGS
ncbi:MAG: hypothetical protein KBT27_16155 [Prevotellaceae bacterium]|nr:hypothetical protein [Candidatus Faecinaster equi]